MKVQSIAVMVALAMMSGCVDSPESEGPPDTSVVHLPLTAFAALASMHDAVEPVGDLIYVAGSVTISTGEVGRADSWNYGYRDGNLFYEHFRNLDGTTHDVGPERTESNLRLLDAERLMDSDEIAMHVVEHAAAQGIQLGGSSTFFWLADPGERPLWHVRMHALNGTVHWAFNAIDGEVVPDYVIPQVGFTDAVTAAMESLGDPDATVYRAVASEYVRPRLVRGASAYGFAQVVGLDTASQDSLASVWTITLISNGTPYGFVVDAARITHGQTDPYYDRHQATWPGLPLESILDPALLVPDLPRDGFHHPWGPMTYSLVTHETGAYWQFMVWDGDWAKGWTVDAITGELIRCDEGPDCA